MNTKNQMTSEQALDTAMEYAGIAETESVCLLNRYESGLYHVLVNTAYMKYEFYVDAEHGEVLGFDMEPPTYSENFCFCGDAVDSDPMAA